MAPAAMPRQRHDKLRTRSNTALDAHATSQCGADLLDDPQTNAKPAALVSLTHAHEALEDTLLICCQNAQAMVEHAQARQPRVPVQMDLDLGARSVADRIGDQVADDLLEPQAVPMPKHWLLQPQTQRTARGAQLALVGARHFARDLCEVHLFDLELQASHSDARRVQHAVEHLEE